MDVDGVLAACGVEEESDVIAGCSLGGGRIEDGEGILVFGIAAFGVRDGAFDFKIRDRLEGIVLRERDPEMAGFCVSIGGNVYLISEAETALGFGGVKSRAGSRAWSRVQQERGRRTEKERGTESEKDLRFRHGVISLQVRLSEPRNRYTFSYG